MEVQHKIVSRKKLFFSRKGWTVGLIIWGVMAMVFITVLIPALQDGFDKVPLFVLGIVILIFILLTWIWFGTYYILTPYNLHYYSGPFRGKIPITSIIWVKHQRVMWSGLRMALAYNGLLIRYNKYDEVYISPADKAAFIYALQQYNPNIKVKLENES